jgi:hypothetical protein
MLKCLSVAACLILAASPALAAEDLGTEPSKDSKVVCKKVETTGWRLSRSSKVCKTQGEWDMETRAQRDELQRDYKGKQSGS